ncbi:hypothetical protein GFY24_05585 [Nocardia sp. SYP-A9097]|uniref:hypothetical protein n=1 Tax=Nocardia sp. SYP-A9097 TaxID=2663237 RepID=UPI00129AB4A9|nr:hypothetical protein [Nocardia sp. SYP-A9097]MRH86941.1 hypothetical protein [Nocardia sp. SYP-A9097]
MATKLDRLADALCNGRAALREQGVYVEVFANGQVRAVVIDDDAAVLGSRLGPVITDLINRAREQAQWQVEEQVRDAAPADPPLGSAAS